MEDIQEAAGDDVEFAFSIGRDGRVSILKDRPGVLGTLDAFDIGEKEREEIRKRLEDMPRNELVATCLSLRGAMTTLAWSHGESSAARATAEKTRDEYESNLTTTQQRCTELLELLRATRIFDDAPHDANRERAPTIVAMAMALAERVRQDKKWKRKPGYWRAPDEKIFLVLGEEVGEIANALLERSDDAHLLEEIIQVAAVAICWAEDFLTDARSQDPQPLPEHPKPIGSGG